MNKLFENVFKNKTVLITGNTGFKGSWLSTWLNLLGANVIGLSIDVPTKPALFEIARISSFIQQEYADINNIDDVEEIVKRVQPDYIFHLAAQALVRPSYDNPLETIRTNSIGTANLMESLRALDKDAIAIMITSDKAYDNLEWPWGYKETDRLGGKDPYSASKGMAELVIKSYIHSFFNSPNSNIRVGITRAGNVIGGGDWAKDRIVADCVKSWSENKPVKIRNLNATRPWQHVLEPLSGYLSLAANLKKSNDYHGQAYNFGPSASQNYPVIDLINEMSNHWNQVKWKDSSEKKSSLYEAGLLKLNCDKALFDLNWLPTLKFKETVKMTTEWYKFYYQENNINMHDFSVQQIEEYVELAKSRKIKWSVND
jgi:CDP-glucose 4,6-dehydratase